MNPWRNAGFWGRLIFGWFVAMMFVFVLIGILGSESMTDTEGWAAFAVTQVLSILAGYSFAIHHFKKKYDADARGFTVITRDEASEKE